MGVLQREAGRIWRHGKAMICYVCSQSGGRKEAVAICILCGMALCQEHLVRQELPVWEKVHTGLGETRVELPAKLPRFLCRECYGALHQSRA
jgi:hypothetical protein